MHCDERLFTCQCEKEDRKASMFQISHFYWSFSSDIMTVKGLKIQERGAADPLRHHSVPCRWEMGEVNASTTVTETYRIYKRM